MTPPSTSWGSTPSGAASGIVGGPGRPGVSRVGPRNRRRCRRRADGTWAVDRKTFGRFGANAPPSYLYPEHGGVVWMVVDGGRLVRFDTSHGGPVAPGAFPALIRSVTTSQASASFGGSGAAGGTRARRIRQRAALRVRGAGLPRRDRHRVSVAARRPRTDWSAWTREARRDYTNLGFGDYRFRVRAPQRHRAS